MQLCGVTLTRRQGPVRQSSVVIDRPVNGGGRGLGFNGGQLLNLAVAGCISNDLFREAEKRGIRLDRVVVIADSDYTGDPAVSTAIEYSVEVSGDAEQPALDELVSYVDRIAEIPASIRNGTPVTRRHGLAKAGNRVPEGASG